MTPGRHPRCALHGRGRGSNDDADGDDDNAGGGSFLSIGRLMFSLWSENRLKSAPMQANKYPVQDTTCTAVPLCK